MPETADNPIRRYKRSHGLTYPQLSELLGVSESLLEKLGCGIVKRVSADLAIQIEERTGGEIKRESMVFGPED